MKFVIWGIGERGMHIVDFLPKGKIAAIVDQDIAIQGSYYEEIEIISPEKYMSEYRNCPVLVTPRGHERAIIQQLNKDGIHWAFSFTDEYNSIESLFRQVSIDELISLHNIKEDLTVWGYSALGLLLYDFLCDKGYSCTMLLDHHVNEHVKWYLQNILYIDLEYKERCKAKGNPILLTAKMSKCDEDFFCENKIVKYYDLGVEKGRFLNPLIEKFKAAHKGERCFIVATGPSLAVKDLDKLYEHKEVCISVNGIFPIFENTMWRPDYYIISDSVVMRRWKEDIFKLQTKAKFVADVACENPEKIGIKWHAIRKPEDKEIPEFSNDFACESILCGTIVYNALQLAAYMGFQVIYLLGVDLNYVKGSQNNYFYQEKTPDRLPHHVEIMQKAYVGAKKYADIHGIKIYNATRGGMLEVFERVNFDSLF